MATDTPYSTKLVTTLEEFNSLSEKWNVLLEESNTDNIFLTWEWLYTWAKHYLGRDQLRIILVFKGERHLVGIAPFYIKNHLWRSIFTVRRLLFLGTNETSLISEYLNIICRSDEQESVIRSILLLIVHEGLCDDLSLRTMESASQTTLHFKQIAESQGFFSLMSPVGKGPYLKLPAKCHDFISLCSPSMRCKIRRQQRKLAQYDAHFRKTETSSQLEKDFSELVRLHQLRWESRQMPGSFAGGKFPLFQKEVMQEMLLKGHLELRFLSISGKNVAVLYNICYRGKIYYYQSGLDVSFDRALSPGLLLHADAIRDAIERGLKEYDFLLAGEMDDYKFSWTRESRNFCDIYMTRRGVIKMSVLIKHSARAFYALMKSIRNPARVFA